MLQSIVKGIEEISRVITVGTTGLECAVRIACRRAMALQIQFAVVELFGHFWRLIKQLEVPLYQCLRGESRRGNR